MKEAVIEVINLKKKYRLGMIGGSTLREELQTRWALRWGKEDPNSKIGATHYGDKEFWALKGINFEVKKGEAVGIIGNNGAGKSTFLKILSRITAPTEGSIRYKGRITSMLEVGTGFHGELTGRENIYLNGAILGMSHKEIDQKIEEIIEFSECREFIDTPVKRYSSGMYVKLAFSVAAHLDSDIMIMDEVLAVGDVTFQNKCLNKMSEISKEKGKTILYVSHNMATIRKLCTRCIVLEKGEVIYQGNVESAIQRYLNVSDTMQIMNNFTNQPRHDQTLTKEVEISYLELISHEKNVIEVGDTLTCNIRIRSHFPMHSLYLRYVVYKLDDTRIGGGFSNDLGELQENMVKTFTCEFDTSQIAPGKYGLRLILFKTDHAGNQIKLDNIYNAIVFKVVSTKGRFANCTWNEKDWGNTAYPDIRIISIH